MKFISQEVRNAIDWAARTSLATLKSHPSAETRDELRGALDAFHAGRTLTYGELRGLSAATAASVALLAVGGSDVARVHLGVEGDTPSLLALRAAREALEAQAAHVARSMA